MKRSEKELYLNNIIKVFSSYNIFVFANFKCLTASESYQLRKELKAVDSGMIIVKNSLARIAFSELNKLSYINDKLSGPVSVFYSSDVVVLSKIIMNFMKKHKEKLSLICASSQDQILSSNEIIELAKLPSLSEVRIKLMQLISYSIPVRLVLCLKSIENNK